MANLVERKAPSEQRDGGIANNGTLRRPPEASGDILSTTNIKPLAVFIAYEKIREQNDGYFILSTPSVLFHPTEITATIDTPALITRIQESGKGSASQNWSVIPPETVAGVIAEVALEAHTREIPLDLDHRSLYQSLSNPTGRGKSLEALGKYVTVTAGLEPVEALPFLLKDLGLYPTDKPPIPQNDGKAGNDGHSSVAAQQEKSDGIGDPPSVAQQNLRLLQDTPPPIQDDIRSAIGYASKSLPPVDDGHPEEAVHVILPRNDFASLENLEFDGSNVLGLITSAVAIVEDRDAGLISISVAPEDVEKTAPASREDKEALIPFAPARTQSNRVAETSAVNGKNPRQAIGATTENKPQPQFHGTLAEAALIVAKYTPDRFNWDDLPLSLKLRLKKEGVNSRNELLRQLSNDAAVTPAHGSLEPKDGGRQERPPANKVSRGKEQMNDIDKLVHYIREGERDEFSDIRTAYRHYLDSARAGNQVELPDDLRWRLGRMPLVNSEDVTALLDRLSKVQAEKEKGV